MIFDTERMDALRERYAGEVDYRVPKVVSLDRSPHLEGERQYIERLIRLIPEQKRAGLLGRLLQDDEGQHVGAWFELMLYGWLREQETGEVEFEPEVEGCSPDFLLRTGSLDVIIEGRAYLISEEEREHRNRITDVQWLLESIERPFIVLIDELELDGQLDDGAFVTQVEQWLDERSDARFQYRDNQGNRVTLSARPYDKADHVSYIGPTETEWVNPEPLQVPLGKKAGQHKAIRNAGYPYLISLFLEPLTLSAQAVAEAWLGREEIVYDPDTDEVLTVRSDLSGQHFYGRQIQHTTVAGTLVFKSAYLEPEQRRLLRAWYIENPYAKVPVDPHLFDVRSRFITVGQNRSSFQMAWRKQAT